MNKKQLVISENKALELYKTASTELKEILEETFGLDFFKPKDITKIVKDLKSLFDYLGMKENELLPYPKPKSDFEKYLNACVLIPEIVKIYNQGIILDWNNTNQYKYIPYCRKVGSGWVIDHCDDWAAGADGSIAHHFKSSEICETAMSNFKQTYLDFYTYKG